MFNVLKSRLKRKAASPFMTLSLTRLETDVLMDALCIPRFMREVPTHDVLGGIRDRIGDVLYPCLRSNKGNNPAF